MTVEEKGLELIVDGYRAVAHAEIVIDTITVLSGVNASGKSSLSHLVHTLVNFSSQYEDCTKELLYRQLNSLMQPILDFVSLKKEEHSDFDFDAKSLIGRSPTNISEFVEYLKEEVRNSLRDFSVNLASFAERRAYFRIIRELNAKEECKDAVTLIEYICSRLDEYSTNYGRIIKRRSLEAFMRLKPALFDWIYQDGFVSFYEDGVRVYAAEKSAETDSGLKIIERLGKLVGVKRAIYLASPWLNVPQLQRNDTIFVGDGFDIPTNREFKPDAGLFAILEGEIVEGKSSDSYIKRSTEWYYRRSDKKSFRWKELATGIKGLSILDILYNFGCLDQNTLLIIDEPEAHLHPQWIVEYAKILVLLAKRYRVRILIASHSPDMVSAIKTISEEEELEGIKFYLAEQESIVDRYKYTYRSLGTDIEPIFKAFNKAIDWVETYERS